MAVNSFLSNQGTQSALLTDNTGGIGGTLVPIMKVSMDGQGTFTPGNIFQGTISQVNNVGTFPNVPGGSIAVTSGTVNSGTINTGTINAGTINNGSIVITTGTMSAGTLNTGTINLGTFVGKDSNALAQTGNPLPMGGTDSGGTIRTIKVDSGGLQRIGVDSGTISVLPNVPGGSIVVTTGTQNAGTTNTGTVNTGTINAGTINTGTINAGTFQQNPVPTIAQPTYGTHGTTGVSVFGTLAGGTGSGAGTEIFITSLSLSIPSTGGSQDCSIGWGTNGGTFQAGTGLLVRGNFPPGSGIQKNFSPAINSGTNAQLCLFQAGAGTVDVNVTYFIAPSTL